AEILRLWVSASDYRDDIRISDNILKQLSDAYRRIRNTCRFMLGNLFDFDPSKDSVPYESMLEIDRFAMYKLQLLIEKAITAYETYEFHIIYHSLYNYCTLDLSAFYLDILKDRLYTSSPDSTERKSAQTVLYSQLDTITRLMAPILPFTSEEIWNYMPDNKNQNICFQQLPEVKNDWKDSDLSSKWERLLDVRGEVTKALEEARAQKKIGHPLDAAVTISITGNDDLHNSLKPYADDLRSIFIVSKASLVKNEALSDAYLSEDIKGLSILIETAPGVKCERCWTYETSVGSNAEHPTICSRCLSALEN
ncbi:MAG: class I tRNA ligase family protein, partial [Deltaproteobacteria bacterium]|nr:class I tRNA ligase family protein [Deltaproteobacteria bacterium]